MLKEQNQLLGLTVRQRANEKSVDQTQHRSASADAKGER
jgi:hypothetical protein